MSEDIPRRMRRFYREDSQEESSTTGNESNDSPQDDSRANPNDDTTPTTNESSEKYQQLHNHTRNEAIALALREVKRFMQQNKRLPRENERDEIAENLYNQMESNLTANEKENLSVAQRAQRRQSRFREEKEPGVTIPKTSEEIGLQSAPAGPPVMAPISSENLDLSNLLLSDPLLAGKSASNDNLLVEKEGVQNACPHCQVKTDHIVYCPSCGNGFCPNCAKSAKNEGEKTNYTCPICAHAFASRNRL